MSIIKLLASDNYFVINREIIKLFGLHEAIMLGELASEYTYWAKENKLENGLFFSTQENIKENTGLSEFQQREAVSNLVKAGVLEVIKKGMPAKNYYRINEQFFVESLNDKSFKNYTTSGLKIKEQVVKKLNTNNNKEKIINKNNKNNKPVVKYDILELIPKLCLEYDIEDTTIVDKLYEFFKVLVDNKALVTEQKIEATISKLAPVDKTKQLQAIQLSLDKGYKSIDPDWVNNNSKGGEHLQIKPSTETWEEQKERVEQMNTDPNNYHF